MNLSHQVVMSLRNFSIHPKDGLTETVYKANDETKVIKIEGNRMFLVLLSVEKLLQ